MITLRELYLLEKEEWRDIIGEESYLDSSQIQHLQDVIVQIFDRPDFLRLSDYQRTNARIREDFLESARKVLSIVKTNKSSSCMRNKLPKIKGFNPFVFPNNFTGDVPLEITFERICRTKPTSAPRWVQMYKSIATRLQTLYGEQLSPDILRRVVRKELGELEEKAYRGGNEYWMLATEKAIFNDTTIIRPIAFIPGVLSHGSYDDSSWDQIKSFSERYARSKK